MELNQTVEVFVELLDEGTTAFRPVQALPLKDDLFEIVSTKTEPDEAWRFPTGAIVR